MSAPVSPVCGRAGARLPVFTASTGPDDGTGGQVLWTERAAFPAPAPGLSARPSGP